MVFNVIDSCIKITSITYCGDFDPETAHRKPPDPVKSYQKPPVTSKFRCIFTSAIEWDIGLSQLKRILKRVSVSLFKI